ncbi:hypothetical protein DL765_009401 [Monosporascus sp. GIB2]|nr:hypothetical protein DL765_009401 [Monosporascus sp. GIB2]
MRETCAPGNGNISMAALSGTSAYEEHRQPSPFATPDTPTPDTASELDGDDSDPIAICGFSIKFPQEATCPESFWKMMLERRCAMTDFPPDRLDLRGFYCKKNRANTIPLRGGHFIDEDLSLFDADFFSISPAEAAAMDPMQRWLLEVAYRALENAGIPMEQASGSSTAVYTGSFGYDYLVQLYRDPEAPPKYAAVGVGLSMLANRLSWFFNLRGPSVGLDTACSSAATALDMASQALKNRSCDMALVAGCSLTFAPEPYASMTNLDFLSPDSRSYSFDHRANGYSRGEGIAVLVLKRLSDAVTDGNTIRAVIRSTASNEDGKTPGITQPSREAQECLIRETYRRSGLSMAFTRYFEAHGTGTPIGDPREAQAIGSAFRRYRSIQDPLYIGAVKSNIGHLEGASGLAGIIKAILVLEKGIIPPNANFEKINPRIDAEYLRIKFPVESCPWPTRGLRRASVNSFGYGGANSHIVLDDAYNYLRLRSLTARHHTLAPLPSTACPSTISNGTVGPQSRPVQLVMPRLLVWSAADKEGIGRVVEAFKGYHKRESHQVDHKQDFLDSLAYTLDSHRSHLPWRSFALLKSPAELEGLGSLMSTPLRVHKGPVHIGYVFSGQGAQWFAMGRELMSYSSFMDDLRRSEGYLRSIGCPWQMIDELSMPQEASKIDDPEFSQTLSTVLQVALVNLLRRFGIQPSGVVGHSSGEISAAYAGGHITAEDAWRLAYFRGFCSKELSDASKLSSPGAMMSVGLSEDRARSYIEATDVTPKAFGISIACINSPNNVTISGEEYLIDHLKQHLDEQGIFARKLRVSVAYHSRQMLAVSDKYVRMIGSISVPKGPKVPMISTVSGEPVTTSRLNDPTYWAANMLLPVQFDRAVASMCAQTPASLTKKIDGSHRLVPVVDHIVEVGPHAALRGPLRDILQDHQRGQSIGYSSVLKRGESAMATTLRIVGELHSMGLALDLRAANDPAGDVARNMLVDMPGYPFDHSRGYWHESRLSRNYRLRQHAPSALLGVRSPDWNPSEARWRHFLRPADMPWVEQHVVNGSVLYPAAGMIVMATEAARQLCEGGSKPIKGYSLRDVHFNAAMDLTSSNGSLEVQTTLREADVVALNQATFEFTIHTCKEQKWTLNCRGYLTVELMGASDSWEMQTMNAQREAVARRFMNKHSQCVEFVDSEKMYAFLQRSGLEYGPEFQALRHQRIDHALRATAEVDLFQISEDGDTAANNELHVVHPVSLDAILQLSFTALTSGGSRPMATGVPVFVKYLWISNRGLSWPGEQSVTAFVTVSNVIRRGFLCDGLVTDLDNSSKARLWYEGFEIANVTETLNEHPNLPNPQQFYMDVDCKPSLDKLSPQETLSLLESRNPDKRITAEFFHSLETLIEVSLKNLVDSFDDSVLGDQEPWRRHYLNWADHHLVRTRPSANSSSQDTETSQLLQEAQDHVKDTNLIGSIYALVSRNLVAMLRGDVNPLELLLQSGQLTPLYDELLLSNCASQAAMYMDLLAHQRPGMNILEVGAGTGAGTRLLINALKTRPGDTTGSLRCNRYDFTDISRAMFQGVQKEFGQYEPQMSFRVLNMDRGLAEQGFQEGDYDLVVAVSVLHVSSNLENALKNLRKALKPGGKLLIQEVFEPSGWTLGFVFGLLPGWWLGVPDNRVLSPNITSDEWDLVLKRSGFSGADITLRDTEQPTTRDFGWIIATVPEDDSAATANCQLRPQPTMIIDETLPQQRALARCLESLLKDFFGKTPRILSLETAMTRRERVSGALTICLLDYGASFLGRLTSKSWQSLKSIVNTSHRLLWVSSGGGRAIHPDYGIIDGLARTLRSEHHELHLVTLGLDMGDSKTETDKSALVMGLVQEMLATPDQQNYEEEYIEVDGVLHTRRLVEASTLKAEIDSKLTPYHTETISLRRQAPFALSMSSPGFMNTPHYVASEPGFGAPPRQDEIDIMIRAVSLQPRDHALALGYQSTSGYGTFCAGFVLRAGPESPYRPGDRIFIGRVGLFRSHLRLGSNEVVSLPAGLSYSDACWIAAPMMAAYEVINDVAHVRASDKILVHDGDCPIGQAAIQLLLHQGIAEIWATASSEIERFRITKLLGIPEQRVLPKSWFEGHPMLVSQWRMSFDVILAVDVDLAVSQTISCVRSGGRYVMFRTSLPSADSNQTIHGAPPTVSFSTIQLGETQQCGISASPEVLRHVLEVSSLLAAKGTRRKMACFAASDVTGAFSHLRQSKGSESVVVEFDNMDIIDVGYMPNPQLAPRRTAMSLRLYQVNFPTPLGCLLNSNATYVVSGGLGGLGRAIARWLASRGARYIMLLSRSGPRTPEAQSLLEEFAGKGIHVETPRCDVTDTTSLRSALGSCREKMPPIKGCVQAAMVMKECIFQAMDFSDWEAALEPKSKGSWNLHSELPKGLDFFFMLSSMGGIIGRTSLAAYNAGNTYQDALAHYRVSQGERGTSFDLGAVANEGYLAQHTDRLSNFQRRIQVEMVYTEEIFALFDAHCSPAAPQFGSATFPCQRVIGVRPPSHWKHLDDVLFTMSQPLWGHLHHVPLPSHADAGVGAPTVQKQHSNVLAKMATAKSVSEAADVAGAALVQRVSSLLGTPEERLDEEKPLHSYGIDSLSAVELRNWIARVFKVDIPLLDILGEATLASMRFSIARKYC